MWRKCVDLFGQVNISNTVNRAILAEIAPTVIPVVPLFPRTKLTKLLQIIMEKVPIYLEKTSLCRKINCPGEIGFFPGKVWLTTEMCELKKKIAVKQRLLEEPIFYDFLHRYLGGDPIFITPNISLNGFNYNICVLIDTGANRYVFISK